MNHKYKFNSEIEFKEFCEKITPDYIMQNQLKNLNLYNNSYNNWLAGFISGEGCFSIKKIKRKEKIYIVKEFCMEQTELLVMELIKKKFNFTPKINIRNRVNRPNSQTTYEIKISSKNDISNLIICLNSIENIGLLGNKLNQYTKWKEIENTVISNT